MPVSGYVELPPLVVPPYEEPEYIPTTGTWVTWLSQVNNWIENANSQVVYGVTSALESVYGQLSKQLEDVKEATSGIVDWITDLPNMIAAAIQAAFAALGNVFENIKTAIETSINTVVGIVETVGQWLWDVITDLGDKIGSMFTNAIGTMTEFFTGVYDRVTDGLRSLGGYLKDGFIDLYNAVSSTIGNIGRYLSGTFTDLLGKAAGSLSNIGNALVDFFTTTAVDILDGIGRIAQWLLAFFDQVLEILEQLFDIDGPEFAARIERLITRQVEIFRTISQRLSEAP